MTDTTLIRRCDAVQAACECGLWEDHAGAHECEDTAKCGGSWVSDEDGNIVEVIRWPGEGTPLMRALFGW